MSPKRSSSAAAMPSSPAQLLVTRRAAMLVEVRKVVNLNTAVDRAGTGSLWIRNTKGKRTRLIATDGKPTQFGQIYYDELGGEAPKQYAYDQALNDDTFVYAFNGDKVIVRRRAADGNGWVITRAGEQYFKFNRTEFQPRVPYLVAKPLTVEGGRANRLPSVHNHPDLELAHAVPVDIIRPAREYQLINLPGFDYMTVGRVRQQREGARPIQASMADQIAEIREAAKVHIQKRPFLIDLQGEKYHVLAPMSGAWFVYDSSREILVDSSTVNKWEAGKTGTEVVLTRRLRNFATPDGFWRPFDLHPSTFEEYAHGCAVEMLHKSFTKRNPNKAAAITQATLPWLTVDEIGVELDICFDEMGYVVGEWPYGEPGGWRQTGVTADLVVHFCKRQTTRKRPVKCAVYHAGEKIHEFNPVEHKKDDPSVVFSIHGEHAYFYDKGRAKNTAACTTVTSKCPPVDEYTNRNIRVPFPHDTCPPFSEWLNAGNFERAWGDSMVDGFAEVALRYDENQSMKRLRVGDDRAATRDSLHYFTTDPLEQLAKSAIECQDRLKGTPRCFGIQRSYGSSPERLSSLTFTGKVIHPSYCEKSKQRRTIWKISPIRMDSSIEANNLAHSVRRCELSLRRSASL